MREVNIQDFKIIKVTQRHSYKLIDHISWQLLHHQCEGWKEKTYQALLFPQSSLSDNK